jgi:ParB family transcriptional regulator, chromosome partitioning protein
MPPKGKLQIGSNIGIDKEQAYKDKIAELQKNQVREIPLALIDEVENVRTVYDQEGIRQLAASIEERGLLQPVLLCENGTRFGIQAGHRRVLAFRLLEKETIPSIVKPSPGFLAELQLIENVQREDLSPADLEVAVKALVDRYGSQEKAAQLLMKSKQWVSNVLAASKVRENLTPILQQHEIKDSLPSGHLRDIAALPPKEQAQAAKEALESGGGKRAFRQAAQKAKEKHGRTSTFDTPSHLFSLTLIAEKHTDGKISVTPKIAGNLSSTVRIKFNAFCDVVRSLLSEVGERP